MRGKEQFFFLIHLLYTILRHKFKQQRIGKSLADQQDQYLLWGTHHLPEFPCSVHRPIRPLQLWAPRPPGQTSHTKMPECYLRVCWTERSTRSRREARWHPGQRGFGWGGCPPRPASQNVPDSAPQKGENTLNQRKPLWASLFTSRFVINTYRCLYVNRILGKPHGNIPLGTRNSGADTGECCI